MSLYMYKASDRPVAATHQVEYLVDALALGMHALCSATCTMNIYTYEPLDEDQVRDKADHLAQR